MIQGLDCSPHGEALACDACASLPKAFNTQGGGSREISGDGDQVVIVGHAKTRDRRGRVEEGGGRKTELERIGFPANETVGRDAGNVLRRFVSRSMAGEKSSVRKRGGVVGDERLRGEESPD